MHASIIFPVFLHKVVIADGTVTTANGGVLTIRVTGEVVFEYTQTNNFSYLICSSENLAAGKYTLWISAMYSLQNKILIMHILIKGTFMQGEGMIGW